MNATERALFQAQEAPKTLAQQAQTLHAEVKRLRDALEIIAAQSSGEVGSTKRSDCMAAIAGAALRA